MRTTLDVNDDLMNALMARSPGESKTKAVERAIREYLAQDAYQQALKLGGSFPDFPDVRDQSREDDERRQTKLDRWWSD